jgi:hypothetical protein
MKVPEENIMSFEQYIKDTSNNLKNSPIVRKIPE